MYRTLAAVLAVICCLTGCGTHSPSGTEEYSAEAEPAMTVPEPESHREQSSEAAFMPNHASLPEESQVREAPDDCFDEDTIRTEMLEVANACLPVYQEMKRSNIFLPTEAEKNRLFAIIAAMGYPSAGENMDMANYQPVLDFYGLTESGQEADVGIYSWSNGLIRACFHTEDGAIYRTHLTLEWTEDFSPIISPIEYIHEEEVFILTEKGWLFYGEEKPPQGHYAYKSGLRVLPLGEENRRMLQYLEPLVTYGGNNVLSESWSDPAEINFNDLFEYLYYYETGTSPDSIFKDAYEFQRPYIKAIPAADFESLIRKYFDISETKLRELCVYDPERQVYAMMTLMHPLYVPDWEVVSSTQNSDGSIELTVHAVSLFHGRDRVAVHRLRVMPLPGGAFHVHPYIDRLWQYGLVRRYPSVYARRISENLPFGASAPSAQAIHSIGAAGEIPPPCQAVHNTS
jgi:hypothetical protein